MKHVFIFIICLLGLSAKCNLNSLEKAVLTRQQEDTAKVDLLNLLCWSYMPINMHKSASFCEQSIAVAKKINYKKGLGKAYVLFGNIWFERGDFKKSLEYNHLALKIREELNDRWGVAGIYGNIGGIYQLMGHREKALEYNKKSLWMFRQLQEEKPSPDNIFSIAQCLMSIGGIHKEKKDYDSAMIFYKEAYAYYKESEYQPSIISAMNEIGSVLHLMKKDKEALDYLYQVLEISRQIGDNKSESTACFVIGDIYYDGGNYGKAIDFSKKCLAISKHFVYKDNMRHAYGLLAKSYAAIKDFSNAYESLSQFSAIKDSLFNEESGRMLAEMQTKYETEKKELLIQNLNKDNSLKETEIKKRNTQLTASAIGLCFLLLCAFLILRGYNVKKKANQIILLQKKEVEKQKEIVEQKNDSLEKAYHEIEVKQKEIFDSITYARRLQEAILPPMKLVKQFLPESFIYYKPKDIVAGDFYWLEKKNELLFFAAADCTGHGVPGAMVSVVCSNALNRAVKEFNILDPGAILDKVRELVIETFEKSESEVKDGMDISLCVLDTKKSTLSWAGANNPLWLISGKSGYQELKEIKPDKQPIGKYAENIPFTSHSLKVSKGDRIYIFTDGYCDQFGGPSGKKFKAANFKKLLLATQSENMTAQMDIISDTFEQWRGKLDQVDDVCVIGLTITT